MSEFDPYLKWLGIREPTRPVNHYRLLGLELFESDKDVISMAADRQMGHIRTYQSGPNGKLSQQILNELARARRCLLVDEKKAVYDQQLRATLKAGSAAGAQAVQPPVIAAQAPTPVVEPQVVQPTVVPSSSAQSNAQASSGLNLDVKTDPDARKKTKNREKKELIWGLISWISGGLAAVGVSAFLIGSGMLGNVFKDDPTDPDPNPDPNSTVLVEHNNEFENKFGPDPDPNPDPDPDKPVDKPKPAIVRTLNDAPGLSFEMPAVWTLKDRNKYPQPNDSERELLEVIDGDIRGKHMGRLGSSAPSTAGTNGIKQKVDGVKNFGFMIGVAYLVDSDLKIKKLQPLFRTKTSIGQATQATLSGAKSLLAKPGYAVGEVQASVLSPLNCVRLRFMKVTPSGLDPDDSYFSSWIGRKVGPVRTIANPLSAPIVGTYSDLESNSEIRTLGLIAAHNSMTLEDFEPTPPSPKPTPTPTPTPSTPTPSTPTPKPTSKIVGNSLPVISRGPIASNFFTSGTPKETIVFVNNLEETVGLYKVDAKLSLRSYRSISPGSSYTTSTLLGTVWHVKKGDLGVATFRAESGRNTAIIDGRDPDGGRLPEIAGLEKASIPTSGDRSKAMKDVKEVYGGIISNAEAQDALNARRVAEDIIEEARDSGEDSARQYMMFESAKDLAIAKGDCRTAMLALREIDRRFEDFDFWSEVVRSVQTSGKNISRTGDKFMASELEGLLRVMIDDAIFSGESRTAGKLVDYGMKAASRNGNDKALQYYKSKDREASEVSKLQKQYENAVVKLAGDPENSNANIQKGRYLIVVRRDFSGALECWGKSDDEELLGIVESESTGANASFLARRWLNLGKDAKTAFGRRCVERAMEVYSKAGRSREASELGKLLDQ